MKHLILTITMMTFCIITQAQDITFRFLSGGEINTEIIESTHADNRFISPLLDGVNVATNEAENIINVIPFVDDVELGSLDDWADKPRFKTINRYMLTAAGQLSTEGVEIIGTVRVGASMTERQSIPKLPGLSAGASASVFVNPGIINLFGGDMEPVSLSTFNEFKWYECFAIGYTLGATSESLHTIKGLNSSLDAKIQINVLNDRELKDRYLTLFGAYSHYLNRNITSSFRVGVLYSPSK